MSRLGAWFWPAAAAATLLATFAVKYAVQNLETDLARIRQQTAEAQRRIHDLHAEWSYLTQPERLAALNRQFLALVPEMPRQLEQTIADIPFRLPQPPDAMVADAAPAAPMPPGRNLALTPVALDGAGRTTALAPARQALDRLFAQVAGGR